MPGDAEVASRAVTLPKARALLRWEAAFRSQQRGGRQAPARHRLQVLDKKVTRFSSTLANIVWFCGSAFFRFSSPQSRIGLY
jgi:hypothetical protein